MSNFCERFEAMIPDALSGRLDVAQAAELETHCEICAECRALFGSFEGAAQALERAFPSELESESESADDARQVVWRRIERSVRVQSARLPQPPARIPYWAPMAAAAAMVALAVLLFAGSPRSASAPTTSPAKVVETKAPRNNKVEPGTVAPVAPVAAVAVVEQPAPRNPSPALPDDGEGAGNKDAATIASAPVLPPSVPSVASVPLIPSAPAASTRGPREVFDDANGLALLRRTGPVAVFDAQHSAWRDVVAGERIPYGASLRTAAGALAELAFGESRVRVDEQSDVTIAFESSAPSSPPLLAGEGAGGRGSRAASLTRGRIRVDLLRSEIPFLIRSGGGTVELTGTVVDVDAPVSDLAFVRVLEGHVKVCGAGILPANVKPSTLEVTAGQEALVARKASEALIRTLPDPIQTRIETLSTSFGKLPALQANWSDALDLPPSPKNAAIGQLIVKDEQGREAEPLRIISMDVKAQVRGPESITRIDESFYNSTGSTLEGTYYFPVPPGAAISRFAMYVDEKTLIEGEVVECGRARQIYESILHAKRDPALLEWVDGNTFKARIFPIPPRSAKRVIMEYTQVLPAFFDTRRYVFPLVSELSQKGGIEKLSIQVDLATGDGSRFAEIVSPSYSRQTRVEGIGSGAGSASLSLNRVRPTADFVLNFTAPRTSELYSSAYAEKGEQPYLLLGLQAREPAAPLSARKPTPPAPFPKREGGEGQGRDILFVAETSGGRSMQDLAQQRQAISAMLSALNDNDRVAFAAADVGLARLNAGWLAPRAAAADAALKVLKDRMPLGALDLLTCIREAAVMVERASVPVTGGNDNEEKHRAGAEARTTTEEARTTRERRIVFIGAGVPAFGELDSGRIAADGAAELMRAHAAFTAVTLGRSVDALTLSELARRANGFYLELKSDDSLESAAFQLGLSLQTPLFQAPVVVLPLSSQERGPGGEVYPANLGALLPGQEIFLHTRAPAAPTGNGPLHFKLSAQFNGATVERNYDVALPADLMADPAAGRFWARARMDHLLAQPQDENLRREIVELAKTWTLMSPYTSFLVLESNDEYKRYDIDRSKRRAAWKDFEVSAYEQGMRLFDAFDYEKAKTKFERAVTLDPVNDDAKQKLQTVNALLNVHIKTIAEKMSELEATERVKVQEALVQLDNSIDDGIAREKLGTELPKSITDVDKERILADQLENFRRAQDKFRRAKEIINWMPQKFDMPDERATVEAHLAKVKNQILGKEDELDYLRRMEAQHAADSERLRETELFKARIGKLNDQVKDLYDHSQYKAAERLATRVLQIDPNNSQAQDWKLKARGAFHLSEKGEELDEAREERKRMDEDIDETTIGYAPLILYPSNWDQITRRVDQLTTENWKHAATMNFEKSRRDETKEPLADLTQRESEASAVLKKLQKKVSFDFAETPLDEVVAFLRQSTGVTIIVDPKISAVAPANINLRVTDMSTDLALDWILRLANLEKTVKDNAIYISTPDRVQELTAIDLSDVAATPDHGAIYLKYKLPARAGLTKAETAVGNPEPLEVDFEGRTPADPNFRTGYIDTWAQDQLIFTRSNFALDWTGKLSMLPPLSELHPLTQDNAGEIIQLPDHFAKYDTINVNTAPYEIIYGLLTPKQVPSMLNRTVVAPHLHWKSRYLDSGTNETADVSSFRVRRSELKFTMDLHENVTATVMIGPARESSRFPLVTGGPGGPGAPGAAQREITLPDVRAGAKSASAAAERIGNISMNFTNADIRDVIGAIAMHSKVNIVIGPEVTGKITARLDNAPWEDALRSVLNGLDFVAVPEANNTIRITHPAKIAAQTDIRIFRLAYISPEGSNFANLANSEPPKSGEPGKSLIDVLLNIKSTPGQITFEKRSNALVVRDTATALDQMQTIIEKLDQPQQTNEQKLLAQQAANDPKLRNEIAGQAAAHAVAGQRLLNSFDYEDARKELELAVQLNGTDDKNRALLVRVNDLLGVRRDRIKSAIADLYGSHKVEVQEKLVELDNRIDWGQRYLAATMNDPELSLADRIHGYQQAQIALERARELIKYMPVEVNVEDQGNQVNRQLSYIGKAIKAAEAGLTEADREEAQKLREQFALKRTPADRFNLPHREYLIYGKTWDVIASRDVLTAHPAPEDAAQQEIRRKLQSRVTFEFVEQPLDKAVDFLNSLTNVKIAIDPHVADGGKQPVTLRVSDMELELALKWLAKLADLKYDLRDEGVVITGEDAKIQNAADDLRKSLESEDLSRKEATKTRKDHSEELAGIRSEEDELKPAEVVRKRTDHSEPKVPAPGEIPVVGSLFQKSENHAPAPIPDVKHVNLEGLDSKGEYLNFGRLAEEPEPLRAETENSVITADGVAPSNWVSAVPFDVSSTKVTLREVITRGNVKTRNKVIIRQMDLFPGDRIDTTKVNIAMQRLKGRNYFNDDLKITPEPMDNRDVAISTKDAAIRADMARLAQDYARPLTPLGDEDGDVGRRDVAIAAKDSALREDAVQLAQARTDNEALAKSNNELVEQNKLIADKNANATKGIELRIYDVSDLTQNIPDFPGPELDHPGATENRKHGDDLLKIKGVVIKQQQALVIERENAQRAHDEKVEIENELNSTRQTLAAMTKDKRQIEDDLAQQTSRIEKLLKNGVPVAALLGEDSRAIVSPPPEKAPPGFQRFNGAGVNLDLPETAQRIEAPKQPSKFGLFPLGGGAGEPCGTAFKNVAGAIRNGKDAQTTPDAPHEYQGLDSNVLLGDFGDIRNLGTPNGSARPKAFDVPPAVAPQPGFVQPLRPANAFEKAVPGYVPETPKRIDPTPQILPITLGTMGFSSIANDNKDKPAASAAAGPNVDLRNELSALKQQLVAVTKDKRQIEDDLSQQTSRIERLLSHSVPVAALLGEDSHAIQPTISDGRVLGVRPEIKIVMLSLGSQQGVKPGYWFTIKRGDRYITKVQVDKVYPDMCVARFLDGFMNKNGLEVELNDEVLSDGGGHFVTGDDKSAPDAAPVLFTREQIVGLLAALPKTPEVADARAELYRRLAGLSAGVERCRVLTQAIAEFHGEGPRAEAIAQEIVRLARLETDTKVLDAEIELLTIDGGLRARVLFRRSEIEPDNGKRCDFLTRAYADSGKDANFLQPLAASLLRAERYKPLIECLETAVREGNTQAWMWPMLAAAYRNTGDAAGALRVMTQAIAEKPRDAQPRRELSATFDALGRGPEALREARAACEFSPENADNYRNLRRLAEKYKDPAAREWALLSMLKNDWQRDNATVWAEARKALDEIKGEYRKAGQADKIADLTALQREAEATDIVAVLSWNTDKTDVDIHVEEPGNQRVSYNNRTSFRGGNLDRDVTTGYGPETYTLRHAPAGHYSIKVHYYAGKVPTDATVKLTRNQGTAHETTQTFTLHLAKEKEEQIVTAFDVQ